MSPVRAYLWTASLVLLIALPLPLVWPEARFYVRREDSVVENATAGLFLLAAVLAARYLARGGAPPLPTGMFGVVGLLGFLDELSFGERVFRLEMPTVIGVKVDGVHDLAYVSYLAVYRSPWSERIAIAGAAVALLGMVVWFGRPFIRSLVARAPGVVGHPSFLLFGLAAAQILLALSLDLHIVRIGWLFYLEEILEVNAAAALALAVWMLGHERRVPRDAAIPRRQV